MKELKHIATFCLPYETAQDVDAVQKEIEKYDKDGYFFIQHKYHNDYFCCDMIEITILSIK